MVARKFKRGVFVLAAVALCLLILPGFAWPGETAPPEVVQAADAGLGSFLQAIPAGEFEYYGFAAGEDLAPATLGEPFHVYTIAPDKILSYTAQTDFSSLVSPTDLWFFPVFLAGEVRTMLTVDRMDGTWQAVAIGSSGLAKQLQKVKDKWPESKGYEHKFVRIYQARSDFVVLSKAGTAQLAPLLSAGVALGLEKIKEEVFELYPPAEIMPKLIPVVRQNLQSEGNLER